MPLPAGSIGQAAPAMRIVQALHWLKDVIDRNDNEKHLVRTEVDHLLSEKGHGLILRKDLKEGLSALPIWMQDFLRDLVTPDKRRRDDERGLPDHHCLDGSRSPRSVPHRRQSPRDADWQCREGLLGLLDPGPALF